MRWSRFVVVSLFLLSGCTAGLSPEATKFLLPTEPANAQSVSDARKSLTDGTNVTLVGRITAGDNEPFESGKAAFVVTEISADDHQHGPDDDDCPFCKKKAAKAPRAVVRFCDDRGQLITKDARQLFGLKKGQTVVIQGQGEIEAGLDLFVVKANALHIRQQR